MLKYRGYRIPAEGQAERLMLKYYNFMWQLRKDICDSFKIKILENLEDFPLQLDDAVDKEYYKSIADTLNKTVLNKNTLRKESSITLNLNSGEYFFCFCPFFAIKMHLQKFV